MLSVKTIENPKFKNCCLISSECGKMYLIKQNLTQTDEPGTVSSVKDRNWCQSPSYKRREGEIDLSKFLKKDDEFENEIAYTNNIFGKIHEN